MRLDPAHCSCYVLSIEGNLKARPMASITYFVVLSFNRGEDGDLIPERPVESQSAQSAKSYAKALVTAGKAGAIAFQRTGDPSVGEFDEAEILAREGNVPDDLFDLDL